MSSSEDSPTVTGLNIHPIKSCRACSVDEITLDEYGVVDDRRLMVIDSSGRFVSQRKFPILATVTARYHSEEGGGRVVRVQAPSVPTQLELRPVTDGPTVQCSVWDDTIELVDQGQAAADWFSSLIGQSGFYRLVGSGGKDYRRVVSNLPVSLKARLPPLSIGLADAGPVSLISQSSLEDLNRRMKTLYDTEVPLNRFRMNIEIGGVSEAFEEDSWLLVKVGEVPFLAYVNAERCKVTGIDQHSAAVDKIGPLEVLRSYRAPRGPGHAMFGQLMAPLRQGTVRVGDKITVMDKKKK